MSHFGELATHRAIGMLLEVYEAQGRLMAWPVPNGAWVQGATPQDRARRVARMKADRMLRAGVWDWQVLLPGGRLGIIEVKHGDNTLTAEQRAFGDRAAGYGALRAVVRSVDKAQAVVDAWLAGATSTPLMARTA